MDRRFDIDWIRVIAIGLLIIYHSAVAFQSWGVMIGFITSPEPWPALWTPMAILNVWRIPLLFFVSGMGVYFAMQSRTWVQLITERTRRIFVPYLFGIFVIVPIQIYAWRYHYNMSLIYTWNPAHLWFLGNIMTYVVIFFSLFYFLKGKDIATKIFANPFGILIPIVLLVAEALIIRPVPYELYAMTWHGFVLGMIAFFFGYCFASAGLPFWNMLLKWIWIFFAAAAVLCFFRLRDPMHTPIYLIPVESVCWILSIFALGYKYLNRESRALRYLSEAAYPVYIVHMLFQYLGSMLIFRSFMPVQLQFFVLVVFTLAMCLLFYELIIRRWEPFRFLFGLKIKREGRL